MPYLNVMDTEYEVTKRREVQIYEGDTLEEIMQMLHEINQLGAVVFQEASLGEDTVNLIFAAKTQHKHATNVNDIDIDEEIIRRLRKKGR